MAKEKSSWDEIPSIEGLSVDWEYEPENSLGKRAYSRIINKELLPLLGVPKVPVKLVTSSKEVTGQLIDLSQSGLATLSERLFTEGEQVKLGFFLKDHKVVSKGIVRNVTRVEKMYRIGIEFVDLKDESIDFIRSLVSSHAHKSEL